MTHPRTRGRRRRALTLIGLVLVLAVSMVVNGAHAETLFSDNFEDGNTSGWSKSGGDWAVTADGSLALRQSKLDSELARLFAGNSGWANYSVQARVRPLAFDGSARFAGLAARASGATTMYRLVLLNSNRVELQAVNSGSVTVLGGVNRTVATGTWYTLRIEAAGTTIRAFVDGAQVASGTSAQIAAGRIGMVTFHATASFDDVSVDTTGSPAPTTTGPTTTGPTTTTRPTTTTNPGPTTTVNPGPIPTGLVGFAAVNAFGQNGTTGGAGGPTVTVSDATSFINEIRAAGPRIIRVQGMLTVPSGMHQVTSDKTILGVGASSGISGGGLNIGVSSADSPTDPDAVHNVIIRNMNFRNANDDGINVQEFAHHIWIDHNDLASANDGLLDIKRGSTHITVSWNHAHDHTKNMLLGHSDDNASQDVGFLRVTYHHNWFNGTEQRNPRTRFGNPVHVFNNYYFENSDVGVACQNQSGCFVEGNYFENVEEPMTINYAGPSGNLVERNNVFVNSGPPVVGGSGVQNPASFYSYSVDNPNNVKAIVTAGAGTGKIGL